MYLMYNMTNHIYYVFHIADAVWNDEKKKARKGHVESTLR